LKSYRFSPTMTEFFWRQDPKIHRTQSCHYHRNRPLLSSWMQNRTVVILLLSKKNIKNTITNSATSSSVGFWPSCFRTAPSSDGSMWPLPSLSKRLNAVLICSFCLSDSEAALLIRSKIRTSRNQILRKLVEKLPFLKLACSLFNEKYFTKFFVKKI
jgi:hypothetical protein